MMSKELGELALLKSHGPYTQHDGASQSRLKYYLGIEETGDRSYIRISGIFTLRLRATRANQTLSKILNALDAPENLPGDII